MQRRRVRADGGPRAVAHADGVRVRAQAPRVRVRASPQQRLDELPPPGEGRQVQGRRAVRGRPPTRIEAEAINQLRGAHSGLDAGRSEQRRQRRRDLYAAMGYKFRPREDNPYLAVRAEELEEFGLGGGDAEEPGKEAAPA